jgi:hypothetical protein
MVSHENKVVYAFLMDSARWFKLLKEKLGNSAEYSREIIIITFQFFEIANYFKMYSEYFLSALYRMVKICQIISTAPFLFWASLLRGIGK